MSSFNNRRFEYFPFRIKFIVAPIRWRDRYYKQSICFVFISLCFKAEAMSRWSLVSRSVTSQLSFCVYDCNYTLGNTRQRAGQKPPETRSSLKHRGLHAGITCNNTMAIRDVSRVRLVDKSNRLLSTPS